MKSISKEDWRKTIGSVWVNTYYTQQFPEKGVPLWSAELLWREIGQMEKDFKECQQIFEKEFNDEKPSAKLAGIISDPIILQQVDKEHDELRVQLVHNMDITILIWLNKLNGVMDVLVAIRNGIANRWGVNPRNKYADLDEQCNEYGPYGMQVLRVKDLRLVSEHGLCYQALFDLRFNLSDNHHTSKFYYDFKDQVDQARKHEYDSLWDTPEYLRRELGDKKNKDAWKWCHDHLPMFGRTYGLITAECKLPEWRSETDYDVVDKDKFEEYRDK